MATYAAWDISHSRERHAHESLFKECFLTGSEAEFSICIRIQPTVCHTAPKDLQAGIDEDIAYVFLPFLAKVVRSVVAQVFDHPALIEHGGYRSLQLGDLTARYD